jgi:hypothetical protein
MSLCTPWKLRLFSASQLDGGENLTLLSSCLTPGKELPYTLNNRLGGLQTWSGSFLDKKKNSIFRNSNLGQSRPKPNYATNTLFQFQEAK